MAKDKAKAVVLLLCIAGVLMFGLGVLLLFAVLLFTSYRSWLLLPALAYVAWQVYDRSTPERGGRASKVSHWPIWNWVASYFPVELHREIELPADRNYLFGCHPHGALPLGAVLSLMTEASGFSEKFPGMSPRTVMLQGNFSVPVHRETVLNLGLVPASKQAISYLLDRRNGVGRIVVLMIGGSREIVHSKPGDQYVFLVNSRRGFARIALEQGASLVPVISFGINDVYEVTYYPKGSIVRCFQDFLARFTRIPMPLPRGIGLLPKQCPLNTVVGAPIHVEQVAQPSDEQVERLHKQYVEALAELFEKNKLKFGLSESSHVGFV